MSAFFEDGDVREALKRAQEEYVRGHSPEKIANAYLKLLGGVR